MLKNISILGLGSLMALTLACGEDMDSDPVDVDAATLDEDAKPTTRLTGQLLDTDGSPVAHAEVSLAIGSVEITDRTMTNADGFYTLDVPVEDIATARARTQEISVLFNSPTDDLEPLGTVEGDYVQLLPATLNQFVDMDALAADAALEMRTAYVPRQGKGFKITDQLIAEGGVLTWSPEGTQYGEDFHVSLIIEPGSIHRGTDVQDELTMTLLEQVTAPMQIPEDGFGPLWTIQPRDIAFDPPAKVRIQGKRMPVLGPNDMQVGESTDLYGASLETGWKLFGDIEMTSDDGEVVTLETPNGIVTHGAWGHVFGNSGSDWGLLVQCKDYHTGERVRCALLDDNHSTCDDTDDAHSGLLKCEQIDYLGAHHGVYSTATEPRCGGCGGANAPFVLATGIDDPNAAQFDGVDVLVRAVALCPEEYDMADMDELQASIEARYAQYYSGASLLYDLDVVADDSVVAELAWRNFSKTAYIRTSPFNCPE